MHMLISAQREEKKLEINEVTHKGLGEGVQEGEITLHRTE